MEEDRSLIGRREHVFFSISNHYTVSIFSNQNSIYFQVNEMQEDAMSAAWAGPKDLKNHKTGRYFSLYI